MRVGVCWTAVSLKCATKMVHQQTAACLSVGDNPEMELNAQDRVPNNLAVERGKKVGPITRPLQIIWDEGVKSRFGCYPAPPPRGVLGPGHD